jgi:hypothetical protein
MLFAMTTLGKVAAGAAAALAAAQLFPVTRTNPPVGAEIAAPPEVQRILRRACWDCHSHETDWGWHTYVAPISWLAVHDVNEGREELNFSRWGDVEPGLEGKLVRKIAKEVGEGEMPPWIYVLAHPQARLTDEEKATLAAWARSFDEAAARR